MSGSPPQLIPPRRGELEARIDVLEEQLLAARDELLVTAVYAAEQRRDQAASGLASPAADLAIETIARECRAAAARITAIPDRPPDHEEVPRP